MSKKTSSWNNMSVLQKTAKDLSDKDRIQENENYEEIARVKYRSLNAIFRRNKDSRELNEKHLLDLGESISELGLIEPLVVDRNGVIIAGYHRYAAILIISKTTEEEKISCFNDLTISNNTSRKLSRQAIKNKLSSWKKVSIEALFPLDIPVYELILDSTVNHKEVLSIEIAENEHRKAYTKKEIITLANKLKEIGYTNKNGRPKLGEKALLPALSVIVGKSYRTIIRTLNENNVDNEIISKNSDTKHEKKSMTNGIVFQEYSYLKLIKKNLQLWQKLNSNNLDTPDIRQKLNTNIDKYIIKHVDNLISEIHKLNHTDKNSS